MLIGCAALLGLACGGARGADVKLRVLVLSGANNHEWKTTTPAFKGSGKPENILFTTESGGGRGFAIFLGHDTTAMANIAWRTLLQRGTEWAASGKVSIPQPPQTTNPAP